MNKLQDLPWDNPRFRNWIAVVQAEKAITRALMKALEPYDLKIGQLDLMMNLLRHPGASQNDIAQKLLVGRSNITMLLPQLEEQGWIRREGDEKDKRVLRLYLTEAGEARLGDALKAYTSLIERVMGQSTPEQCDAMGDVMRRISEMLANDD
ncbi:MAG: MarR family transcriptional regulator [Mesorhizobium sp.]